MIELDAESHTYPKHLLDECSSALLLFCSGRMGAADGHWVREAGLADVTCVDWDAKTLDPFRDAYPAEWTYVEADAFEWARFPERQWDLVSADVPSQYGDQFAASLPLWCALAQRFVTVTYMGDTPMPSAPDGWEILDRVRRNVWQGREYNWLVLGRDAQ